MRGLSISANCLLILFIFVNYLNAQDNFLQGYIVSKDGDTITGEIHFADWEKNPDVIRFRSDPQFDVIKYPPLEILVFSVADDYYRSAIVEVETSPWNLQDLNKDATFSFRTDTVFLRVLVSGNKSLYTYKGKMGNDQFYLGKDNGYDLLLYKEYIKVIDGHNNKVENNKFKGQLIFYLQDCPKIRQIVSNVKYKEENLINVFRNYNSCLGQNLEIHKEKKKVTPKWGVFAGISITSVILKGEEHPILSKMNFPKSKNFTFGGVVDVVFRGNQGKWSLYNELMWSVYRTNASYTDIKRDSVYDIYDINISMDYLKLNNMLRFRYPIKFFSIFANVGISNGVAVKYSSNATKYSHFYSYIYTNPIDPLSQFRTYELGFLLGGGIGIKNFNLEFRYENGSGFSTITSLISRTKRMFITAVYLF